MVLLLYTNISLTEKRLKRGLSKSCENAHIVSKAREIVLNDLVEDGDGEHLQVRLAFL